jgi:hypothetical protein
MGPTRTKQLATAVIAFLVVFWLPAVWTPFWQDDYGFLLHAREAAAGGQSWLAGFFSNPSSCFWRPISVGLYWRFVEQSLDGNVLAAHGLNLLLLLASSAAVGWLAATLLRIRRPETDPALGGVLAMLLYGVHGARFLPVAWASGAQESLLILFSALSLRYWLVAVAESGRFAAMAVLPCAAAALWSKETAVVLPALAAILYVWIRPQRRLTTRAWLLGGLLCAVTIAWWIVRQRLTAAPPPEYQIRWGVNVARNAACLGLFSMNLPREAIRFVWEERSAVAAVWGAACVALEVAGCILLSRGARGRIGRRDLLAGAAFVAVALAPHLPLGWNCYEYYTSLALVAYAIVAAMAASRATTAWIGAALIVLSSAVALAGNELLPYPSLVARARWGQRQLEIVRAMREADPKAFQDRIGVQSQDDHRYTSFGATGLAYVLDKGGADIVKFDPSKPLPMVLVVPAEGDVYRK